MAKIKGSVAVDAILHALTDKGVISEAACKRVSEAHGLTILMLTVLVDSSELVDTASTDDLIEELDGRDDFDGFVEVDAHEIAEGISYIRQGESVLAEAMLARGLDGVNMAPISTALRS